jgi:hypothetical protein
MSAMFDMIDPVPCVQLKLIPLYRIGGRGQRAAVIVRRVCSLVKEETNVRTNF